MSLLRVWLESGIPPTLSVVGIRSALSPPLRFSAPVGIRVQLVLQRISVSGRIIPTDHACATASIPRQNNHNLFIFLRTTPNIRGGSRAWNKLFTSAAFGPRMASQLSALAPSVLRDRPIVAAITSFTPSLISCHRSCCSRNVSNCVVICVIIIPN